MASTSISQNSRCAEPIKKDKRWRLLEATMKRHQYRSDALIEVLHKAQELFGYLSPALMASISKELSLPLSQIYGVATFYHFFSLAPKGLHSCTVCLGTVCYVNQAAQLLAVLEEHLGIHPGETTTDGEISLSTARCLGACGIAPIRQARRYGLLGSQIFESPFDFRIDLRIGAGAFVCGEETALVASIEGKRGIPQQRPPYPAESGLWGHPTLINNVETFANIAPIIRNGADWYASIGTEKSKGTKVFSLTGKVKNAGLIEVPMGISIREVVEVMGEGAAADRHVKAIQTGGPSGGCIPPTAAFDTSVDYESLQQLGSIMGSGGLIVMDIRRVWSMSLAFLWSFVWKSLAANVFPVELEPYSFISCWASLQTKKRLRLI